jgi:hypothetical protein
MRGLRAGRQVAAEDLIHFTDYKLQRKKWIKEGIALTKRRRVFLGPHASLSFSNYESIWIQVIILSSCLAICLFFFSFFWRSLDSGDAVGREEG